MNNIIKYYMEDEFQKHRSNLDVFLTLKTGDKIMKYGDTLYSVQAGTFQFVKRWLNSESREKTLDYLNFYFKDLMDFLKKVIIAAEDKNIDIIFLKKIREYINSIMKGIFSLKETYPTFLELHCKVSAIIRSLIEFKTNTLKYTIADFKYHQF